jgi:type VI secretion system secreted protein VgrG
MAKEIIADVSIEGKKIAHFSSITINQQFNAHHTFQLTVSHDVMEQLGSHTIQSSQDYIGKRITIAFGETSSSDNTFKGLITEVGMQQSQGLWGSVILKGYSPTFLMESGENYASYYKKSLTSIVQDITGKMAVHDMHINVKPKNTKTFDYICQYKESNFSFVNRLAAEYGEWFFYNGEDLYFGKPGQQSKVELIYGEHIDDMSFAMRIVPSKVTHFSYNSADDKVNKANSPSSVDGAGTYTKRALSASDELFKTAVVQPASIRTPDKQQLDEYAKTQKGIQAASTVLLTAHGDNPKVKLGCHVDIKVAQKERQSGETPEHGEYLVTGITHHLSGTGEYTHTFEALPSTTNYLPVNAQKPVAETQMAIVKDNKDPNNMGRVRVSMLWQEDKGEMTDWIRVLTPDAGTSDKVGKNRGFVFIPEVNDQVFVSFRYNDPTRPFVLGSAFHGKSGGGGGSGNKTKSLTTRSGSTVTLDDDKGSVTVSDPSGNTIVLNGDGTMTVTAPNKIDFNSKEININGSDKVNVSSKLIDVNGTDKVSMESKEITADGSIKVSVNSKTKVEMGAPSTNIEGKMELKLKSTGIIDVEGTTMTNVKGGMLNLNS